jgi:2-polyprenyl-3-methyl-5-hydroxy-6-metoxy-1,4-benzoquinol methylase
VEGNVATARKKLEGRQFDCLLVLDVLHLIQDPAAVISTFVPLLRPGGTVIVQVPRVLRFTTAYRVIRGDQRLSELGNYEKTGIHFTSLRIVRQWLENSGLRIERVATEMPSTVARMHRSLQRVLNPIRAIKMDAKVVFTATKL